MILEAKKEEIRKQTQAKADLLQKQLDEQNQLRQQLTNGNDDKQKSSVVDVGQKNGERKRYVFQSDQGKRGLVVVEWRDLFGCCVQCMFGVVVLDWAGTVWKRIVMAEVLLLDVNLRCTDHTLASVLFFYEV